MQRLKRTFQRHECDGLFLSDISYLGIRLPLIEIMRVIGSHTNFSVIDGAQALNQRPIDLSRLGCDLYLTGTEIVLAARMYHAGLARVIVCTEERIASVGGDKLDPAEEAAEILSGLGVPAEDIQKIGGVNTTAEMRILAKTIKPGERVGLITSAWHMNRALRLACGQGLQLASSVTGGLLH